MEDEKFKQLLKDIQLLQKKVYLLKKNIEQRFCLIRNKKAKPIVF